MNYLHMGPGQIRAAISDNLPVVVPLGVLEYHGEHLPMGMDMLAVTRIMERLEQEMDLIVFPPFSYGAASFAVAGPEGTGTIQVGSETLLPFAEELFGGMLRVGFRNIHGVIHHQTENFASGMPTDLAFRLGARQATFRHLESRHGEGWWGRPEMRDYYSDREEGQDPFSWISIHPLMDEEITSRYPFDHAGAGETSLMLALAPETVDLGKLPDNEGWYTESAEQASLELGRQGVEMILERFRRILRKG